MYVLELWGVQVAPLLAGLGIEGLALVLALQPLLGNLFNGLALMLDGTFKVWGVIKPASGEMETLDSVGLRTTKIKTFDNEMFIVPNTRLTGPILQNFFPPDKSVRGSVDYGVEYGDLTPGSVKRSLLLLKTDARRINSDGQLRKKSRKVQFFLTSDGLMGTRTPRYSKPGGRDEAFAVSPSLRWKWFTKTRRRR